MSLFMTHGSSPFSNLDMTSGLETGYPIKWKSQREIEIDYTEGEREDTVSGL